jgi:hypothetical protein
MRIKIRIRIGTSLARNGFMGAGNINLRSGGNPIAGDWVDVL